VIMLDADNTPLKNPEVLFESKEYREGGNLYWPDWWDAQGWLRPAAYSLFGIMPPWLKEGGENFITAESGQMILNRCSLTRAYVNLLSRSPGLWSSFPTKIAFSSACQIGQHALRHLLLAASLLLAGIPNTVAGSPHGPSTSSLQMLPTVDQTFKPLSSSCTPLAGLAYYLA